MSRGGQHGDFQPAGIDDLTVAQRHRVTAQELGIGGAHGRTGALEQLVDAVGVIAMAVTDQHQRDAAQRGDSGNVLVVGRPGIDDNQFVTTWAAEHPGVGALQGQQTRVIGNQDRGKVGDRP